MVMHPWFGSSACSIGFARATNKNFVFNPKGVAFTWTSSSRELQRSDGTPRLAFVSPVFGTSTYIYGDAFHYYSIMKFINQG